jgi:hypothetical protein
VGESELPLNDGAPQAVLANIPRAESLRVVSGDLAASFVEPPRGVTSDAFDEQETGPAEEGAVAKEEEDADTGPVGAAVAVSAASLVGRGRSVASDAAPRDNDGESTKLIAVLYSRLDMDACSDVDEVPTICRCSRTSTGCIGKSWHKHKKAQDIARTSARAWRMCCEDRGQEHWLPERTLQACNLYSTYHARIELRHFEHWLQLRIITLVVYEVRNKCRAIGLDIFCY